jgi:flagellar hook assembly protein FlgD
MPNPFNPSTSISFALPEASAVKLVIFDALGQTVRTLVDERRSTGRYTATWDGRDGRGVQVSSGVYFYRLQAGAFSEVRRMMLIK